VTGEITQGKVVLPGSELVLPHKVVVLIHSDVLIDGVTVGGTPARLTDAALQQWEALLSQADLERNRAQGAAEAALEVSAIDLCKTSHPIETAMIALGPSPNIAVSELELAEQHEPMSDCSIPTGGSVRPILRVTASIASVGAKVTVRASQGLFAEGTASAELTLANANTRAEAMTFFVPGDAPGTAVITASGKGSTATPIVFHVVDRPVIAAPTTALERDVTYHATVSTLGNLESCLVEAAVTGAATVTIVEPDLGVITDVTSVREDPLSCAGIERVRVAVRFEASAPAGAAVTLRCFDTYGRDQSKTFTIAPPPSPP
jgi:hypothetical protein